MVYELQILTEDRDLTATFNDGALSDSYQAMSNLEMFFNIAIQEALATPPIIKSIIEFP